MATGKQSEVFKPNIFFWKIFAMWPEETSSNYYKFYCIVFLTITSALDWILFTLSLLFTPFDIEIIITQTMFFFTQFAVLSKIGMILFKQNEILQLFHLLDSEEFRGDEEIPIKIVNENKNYYKKCWKSFAIFYLAGICVLLIFPNLKQFFGNDDSSFPLCQYYFLTDEFQDRYFTLIFFYQLINQLIHIACSLSVDTFIYGLLLMAITQYKVLNWKMSNLRLRPSERTLDLEEQEIILKNKLDKNLRHYDLVLKYCKDMQRAMGFSIFAQFSTGATTISISMCKFLMPMTTAEIIFLGFYIAGVNFQIFVPSYLGALLTQRSTDLVFSAYCSDWIPRPESFKRNLRLMVESAKRPVVVTGLQMVPLSLGTYTSIIKMAYSIFTLLRSVKDE